MRVWRTVAGGTLSAVVSFVIAVVSWRWLCGGDDLLPLLGGVPMPGVQGLWTVAAALGVQLGVGAVSAVPYALVFEWVARRATWTVGAGLGLAHAAVAGLVAAFVPLLYGEVSPATVPGAFLSFRGWPVTAAFVAEHLVYGALVGVFYGPVRPSVPGTAAARWSEIYPHRGR